MDIAGLSMSMASNNLQTKIGTAVLSKAMDTNEALGQGIVQMIDSAAMERSVTPELGANIDLRIDRKSTRLNSSHVALSRMPSSA